MSDNAPVITLDGPSGVGKGTISALMAEHLNWHYLDSGALYRLTGLAAVQKNIDFNDFNAIAELAEHLNVQFMPNGDVLLDNENVESLIRTEQAGNNASKVAAIPQVREALLIRQKNFLQSPGLVADGRDMGTTIFPDAMLKVYLTASPEERAKRRYKQLIEKGIDAKLQSLIVEIQERDDRDMNRSASPLKPAEDAHVIDTSHLTIDEVFKKVMHLYSLQIKK